eukprot:CAMPEP_0172879208 /NCGR_PEP_ID=MMETSP1075-20121228/111880_1 /TAXON_ID=2916 /ORGANISM="Ceratium fusus, Strain PA161109" /LENGTH=48 /DNA_ID= /DNA_START= /DNA_END= /DNA_ORIENTATION=
MTRQPPKTGGSALPCPPAAQVWTHLSMKELVKLVKMTYEEHDYLEVPV